MNSFSLILLMLTMLPTILMSDQLQADTRPPINAFAAAWA